MNQHTQDKNMNNDQMAENTDRQDMGRQDSNHDAGIKGGTATGQMNDSEMNQNSDTMRNDQETSNDAL